jgi:HEAT repeat protein
MLIQRIRRFSSRSAGLRVSKCFAGSIAALILSITHQAASAISPVPTPPCPANLSTKPTEQLATHVADPSKAHWWRECAANALAEKGAEAVPVLIRLLQYGDLSTQFLAIDHVYAAQEHGGAGRKAVPLIVRRLKTYNLDNPYINDHIYGVYWALAALGKDATPAIPVLIEKSRSDKTGVPVPESYWAIETLGRIGKYDTKKVVPHLIRLLDEPSHRVDAANALAGMTASARSAVPALTRHLETSLASMSDKFSESVMWALARCGDSGITVPILTPILLAPGFEMQAAHALREIGPAARPAVPYLLSRLENSSSTADEKITDVLALLVIDPDSVETLQRILAQATRSNSYDIADELAHAKAFPAALTPDLKHAIDTAPDPRVRQLYIDALKRTHSRSMHVFNVSKTS